MFRTFVLSSALAAGTLSASAMALPTEDAANRPTATAGKASDGVLVAQNGDFEIYYDGRGNRVLVDPYTGKVVAIQPPNSRLDRRAFRRQRDVSIFRDAPDPGEDRYYLDDPEDMARFRRKRMEESGRVVVVPPPDQYDPNYGSDQVFPDAPGDDQYGNAYPDDGDVGQPRVIRPKPVERQPLNEASIEPVQPDAPMQAEPPRTGNKVTVDSSLSLGAREDIAGLQILLDRAGASPGVIDGRFGSNVDKALAAYNEMTGKQLRSTDAVGIKAALAESGGDPFASYTITPEDAAGPYVASVPADYGEKAKLERMSFTSVTEALAERFHMDENYLKSINPGVDFTKPGTIVKVANFGRLVDTPVASILADKGNKQVRAYDAAGKLVAVYPATIGSADTPSPSGTHAVSRIAFDPNYTYNPNINFKQGENSKVLTIPPGPNGPVGSIWIALDKPTYGIHGTPDPSKIGKTESHGCVRLTNWDARELARLVKPGVTVEFID